MVEGRQAPTQPKRIAGENASQRCGEGRAKRGEGEVLEAVV